MHVSSDENCCVICNLFLNNFCLDNYLDIWHTIKDYHRLQRPNYEAFIVIAQFLKELSESVSKRSRLVDLTTKTYY